MIRWTGAWERFEANNARYYVGELQWEIEPNPMHPLHGKKCRIEGWIPGFEHFIVYLKGDGRYAHVLLIWRRDEENFLPYCEILDDTDAVNTFIDKWNTGE